MIAIASLFTASAVSVPFCVEFKTYWVDEGVGDFWASNSQNPPARYLKIEVTDDFTTHAVTLDASGCTTLNLSFASGKDQRFDVLALGHAKPRGFDVELRHHAVVPESEADGPFWVEGVPTTFTWLNVSTPFPGSTRVLTLDAVDGWQVLAIATWMLHRNSLNLDQPNSRGCCLDGFNQPNGECLPPPLPQGVPYLRTTEPYLVTAPKVAILTHDGGSCCGSDLQWTGPEDWRSGFHSGASSGLSGSRFAQAHELGHVMVGVRMGGKERGQYVQNAPENGCRSQRRPCNSTELANSDPECMADGWRFFPAGDRATFTKEFGSGSAREGRGDFMSAWTWNNRTQSDCAVTMGVTTVDLDMDGDNDLLPMDPGSPLSGTNPTLLGCAGDPQVSPIPGNSLAGFVSDKNWLDDVLDNTAACGPVTSCSSGAGNARMEGLNRSTVYDWSMVFWRMTTDEGFGPDVLSDLYVDTCPRGWRADDDAGGNTCTDGDDLPLRRLEISAAHHGIGTELATHIGHVEH